MTSTLCIYFIQRKVPENGPNLLLLSVSVSGLASASRCKLALFYSGPAFYCGPADCVISLAHSHIITACLTSRDEQWLST